MQTTATQSNLELAVVLKIERNTHANVGTELLVLGGLGFRHAFGERWILAQRIGVTQHRTNWEVRDSVSGRSAQVENYTTIGLSIGVDDRF